jgi:hypothetical protein
MTDQTTTLLAVNCLLATLSVITVFVIVVTCIVLDYRQTKRVSRLLGKY